MLLLPFLEETLGAIALWPTYVLRLLFVDASSLLGVMSLAAFFYGNAIPMNDAILFYLTCHGYDDVSFITASLNYVYDEWNESSDRPMTVLYFSMQERLYRFVNGPVLPVLEEFSNTGFDSNVGRTPEVERRLEMARRCPYIPQAFYCVLEDRVSLARHSLFPD
jgi:hypothetical protein